jgi:Ca-activated chloride channel family protein
MLVVGLAVSAANGQSDPSQMEPVALQTAPGVAPAEEIEAPIDRYRDPVDAYQNGAYDQALQGFLDDQIEHPEDPIAALNVGSAHYEMRNYSEADRAFATAALSADPTLRNKALYSLGNSAYRQGRLQEAVELYKQALELDPEDVDAKFNLEFVRDEIRRRHEEAQNRQQQQDQQQQDQKPDQQSQQEQESPGSEDQESPQDEQGEQNQEPEGSESDQPQPAQGADSDQDGLPDQVETSGANPTDPDNPDSDGDGLPDGAEDLNRNGQVDPQETDPNNPDTDGDGVPDAQQAQGGAGEPQQEGDRSGTLTPEEAERYLQALEEGRPVREQTGRGRQRRTDKDW